MKRSLAILGLILWGIPLFVFLILDIKNIINEAKDEVNTILMLQYLRQLNAKNKTENISFNLPLCGQGYESFIFNVSNGKILKNVHTIHSKTPKHLCRSTYQARNSLHYTERERGNFDRCQKENSNPSKEFKKNYEYLKDFRLHFLHHLKNKTNSSVIEIGGNKDAFTKSLLKEYRIQHYVVVEPIRKHYANIFKTLEVLKRSDVRVYQFGLGNDYSVTSIKDTGDATYLLPSNSIGNSKEIVHTINFFLRLGVACHDIDLLNINCEGCEFDVLEMLVSTNLIDRFVNIQFHPYCRRGLIDEECACRYCRIHQLLNRTHEKTYSYAQIWEAWRRKSR